MSDGIREYNNGVCYCRITAVLVGYGQAYEVGNVACGSVYKGIGRYGVGSRSVGLFRRYRWSSSSLELVVPSFAEELLIIRVLILGSGTNAVAECEACGRCREYGKVSVVKYQYIRCCLVTLQS